MSSLRRTLAAAALSLATLTGYASAADLPCIAPGLTVNFRAGDCASATEIYGLFRSTLAA